MAVKDVKFIKFGVDIDTNQAIKNLTALETSLQGVTKAAQVATQAAATATTAFNNVTTATNIGANVSGIGAVGTGIGNLRSQGNPNLSYTNNSVIDFQNQIRDAKSLLDNLDSSLTKNIPTIRSQVELINKLRNAIFEIQNAGPTKSWNVANIQNDINKVEKAAAKAQAELDKLLNSPQHPLANSSLKTKIKTLENELLGLNVDKNEFKRKLNAKIKELTGAINPYEMKEAIKEFNLLELMMKSSDKNERALIQAEKNKFLRVLKEMKREISSDPKFDETYIGLKYKLEDAKDAQKRIPVTDTAKIEAAKKEIADLEKKMNSIIKPQPIQGSEAALLNQRAELLKLQKASAINPTQYADYEKQIKGIDEQINSLKGIPKAAEIAGNSIQGLKNKLAELKKERLFIDFKANPAAFKAVTDEMERTKKKIEELEGATQKGSNSFIAYAKYAATSILIYQGINQILNAVTSGFNTALETEQFTVAMEVLMKDVTEARNKIGELKAFAASTPLEMTDIEQSSKTLLAFGVSANSLIPTMRMLGDLALGNGTQFRHLAIIYGQAAATGRVMSGDLNQLANRGVPILRELAKQFNKTEGEIRKMASEGKIGFKDLDTAMKSMTGAGGSFENMMERMSRTTEGRLAKLSDDFKFALGDIVKSMLPAIKSIIDTIASGVEAFSNMFVGIKMLGDGTKAFIAIMAYFISTMGIFNAMSLATVGNVGKMALSFAILGNKVSEAYLKLYFFNDTLKAVGAGLLKLGAQIGLILTRFALWTLAIWVLSEAVQKLIEYFSQLGTLQEEISKAKFLAAEAAAEELDHVQSITFELSQQNTLVSRQIEIVNELNGAYSEYVQATLSATASLAEQLNYLELIKTAILNITLENQKQATLKKVGAETQESSVKFTSALSELYNNPRVRAEDKEKIPTLYSKAAEIGTLTNQLRNLNELRTQYESAIEEIDERSKTINALKEGGNQGSNTNFNQKLNELKEKNKELNQKMNNAQSDKVKKMYDDMIKINLQEQKQVDDIISTTTPESRKIAINEAVEYQEALKDIAVQRSNSIIKQMTSEGNTQYDISRIKKDIEDKKKEVLDVLHDFQIKYSSGIGRIFDTDVVEKAQNAFESLTKGYEKMASIEQSVNIAKRGYNGEKKEELKDVKAINDETGRSIKLKQFELQLLRAKIQPILDNTRALQEQRKEMEKEREVILNGGRSSVAEYILPTDKDIETSIKAVRDKAENAYQDLNEQLRKALENLAKQREDALESEKDIRSRGGKNMQAQLNSLRETTDINKYNEQKLKLQKNYGDEYKRIVRADEEQVTQLMLNAYRKRALAFTQYIEILKKERRELFYEEATVAAELNSTMLSTLDNIGVNRVDAAGIIAGDKYKIELQKINDLFDDNYKARKKLDIDYADSKKRLDESSYKASKLMIEHENLSQIEANRNIIKLLQEKEEVQEKLNKYTAEYEDANKKIIVQQKIEQEAVNNNNPNTELIGSIRAKVDEYMANAITANELKGIALNRMNEINKEMANLENEPVYQYLKEVRGKIETLKADIVQLESEGEAFNFQIINKQIEAEKLLMEIQLKAYEQTRDITQAKIDALSKNLQDAQNLIKLRLESTVAKNSNVLGLFQELPTRLKRWKNTPQGIAAYEELAALETYRKGLEVRRQEIIEEQKRLQDAINNLIPSSRLMGPHTPEQAAELNKNMPAILGLTAQKKGVDSRQQALTDAELKAQNEIQQVKNNIRTESDKWTRDKALEIIDGMEQLGKAVLQGLSALWQAEANLLDKLIDKQQKKVDEARQHAIDSKGAGDAEMLQLEEERLNKLNQMKKDNLDKQRNLATAELIINTVLSVSRALLTAAGNPIAAAISVAATLATLGFGLAAAKAQAQADAASFATGGYTGDKPGDAKNRPTNISKDPNIAGVVHTQEFVFPKHHTAVNRDIFEGIYNGDINLRDTLNKAQMYESIPDSAKANIKNVIDAIDNYRNNNVSGFINSMSKTGMISNSFREVMKNSTVFNNFTNKSSAINDINKLMIMDRLQSNSFNTKLVNSQLPVPTMDININYNNKDNNEAIEKLRDDIKVLTKIIAEQERLSFNLDADGLATMVTKKQIRKNRMKEFTK